MRQALVRVLLLTGLAASTLACRTQAPEPLPVAPPGQVPETSQVAQPAPSPGASELREATLLLMADIRGVLRPCGCTVELQKGGFDRLVPWLATERAAHPGAVLVHSGPLFFEAAEVEEGKKAQRVEQAKVAAGLVARTGMAMAGLTAVDLAASKGGLGALTDQAKLRLTAANLKVKEGGPKSAPWLVETVGGLRVGVFALASPTEAEAVKSWAALEDPAAAAEQAVAALSKEADVVVLLSALGLRETKRLVRAVKGIDFALAGGLGEAPVWSDEAELVGGTRVMQFHREGRYVGRLSLRVAGADSAGAGRVFLDASAPSQAELDALDGRIAELERGLASWAKTRGPEDRAVVSAEHHLASLKDERKRLSDKKVEAPAGQSSFSFRLTPLNWDLPEDPDVLALMDAFDEELKRINLAHAPTLPEARPGEAVYVGVDTCLECHEEVQPFWDGDRHHKAWATLEKLKKTFDAECISCHVTGYGKAGGSILGKTEGREDVQCEACHGPGSKHAESEDADDIVATPTAETCGGCHNEHHSPSFEWSRYKKKLMVPGHGLPAL